jgi:hypothetical protein
MFFQKIGDLGCEFKKPVFISAQNNKIVSIADIVPSFHSVLHELVKAVHINVYQKLTGQIAERQSPSRLCRMETPNNFRQKSKNIFVGYVFLNALYQVASFFVEVSAYPTLYQTLVGHTLGVWILVSVARNPRNLIVSRIFTYYLLYFIRIQTKKLRTLLYGA